MNVAIESCTKSEQNDWLSTMRDDCSLTFLLYRNKISAWFLLNKSSLALSLISELRISICSMDTDESIRIHWARRESDDSVLWSVTGENRPFLFTGQTNLLIEGGQEGRRVQIDIYLTRREEEGAREIQFSYHSLVEVISYRSHFSRVNLHVADVLKQDLLSNHGIDSGLCLIDDHLSTWWIRFNRWRWWFLLGMYWLGTAMDSR